MRTVLHIGMLKTGSTVLQESLSRSGAYLSSRGVLYPENTNDVKFNNHRLLVQPLMDYRSLPGSMRDIGGPEDLEAWHSNFVTFVREQVKAKPDCLLLSSEHLFRGLAGDRPELLLQDLEAIGAREVEVVVYIRRPSNYFLSLCQQRLKTNYNVTQPAVPNYSRSLCCCAELFGYEHVNARLFSRAHLVGGDVVTDFCSTFLSSEGVERSGLERVNRTNETVSAESMDILRRYRADFDAGRNGQFTSGSNKLYHALRLAETAVGATRPRLKPEIADLIDYSSGQMLWLRDKFGVEIPDLDYERLTREGPVEIPDRKYTLYEMVEIDSGVRDRLLLEIGPTWASGNEFRQAWIEKLLNETAGRMSRAIRFLRRRAIK